MSISRLQAIWHFCSFHQYLLSEAEWCGCFYCQRLFLPTEITEWVDEGHTALCPYCGVDAVLPDAPLYTLNAELLLEMHEAFFLS